jgi:hypothetical protein
MRNNFYIGPEPVKRKNVWIVTIYLHTSENPKGLIDSENSFKTKRDAKLFIAGWLEFLECYKRIGN